MPIKFKAFVDGEAELTGAKGKPAKGFRFNAYLWLEDDDGDTVAEVYIKSLRVLDGVIHLPSTPARFKTFPAVFLSADLARALYEAVNDSRVLREKFGGYYPLLDEEICVAALLFPAVDYKRDFPRLAAHKGLLGR